VRSQVRSGLSQALYCQIYGIPRRVFAQWRLRWWQQQLRPLRLVPVAWRVG
jgi:hypothetical protein